MAVVVNGISVARAGRSVNNVMYERAQYLTINTAKNGGARPCTGVSIIPGQDRSP